MLKTLTSPYTVGVISRILAQLITFVSIMLTSRYVDLASFGSFVLAWTVTVIFTGLIYTGFYQALLRSDAPDHDASSYFWLMGMLALTGTCVSGTIGLIAGGTATETGLAFVLLAPGLLLTFPIAWNEAQLVAAKRLRTASIYALIAQLAMLAATWIALRQGYGIVALIIGDYVASFVALALTFALVRYWPRFEIRRAALRHSMGTVPNLWGTSLLAMFSNYGADLILGAFLNPAATGAYRGGSRITQTISDFVLQPLGMLSWSRFSRLEKQGQLDQLRDSWSDNMSVAGALIWPMMLSLALLAAPMVQVIFEETWLPAASVVVILAASRAIRFLSALLEPTLLCTGQNRKQLQIRLAGAALFLVTLLAFGRLSAEMAATAHLVSSVGIAILATAACNQVLGLSMRDLCVVLLPGAVIALACAALIIATAPLRASMGVAPGLFATIAALILLWSGAMALCLKRGWLRLPQP